MRLAVEATRELCRQASLALGFDADEAEIIAEYYVDTGLREVTASGPSRFMTMANNVMKDGRGARPIAVTYETPISAQLDGGDQYGFLVAHRAATIAIAKAAAHGIAVVGANHTHVTGNLAHWAAMAARHDLVALVTNHAIAVVAPAGASRKLLGTNPICFGFPAAGDPVVWDITTAGLTHKELLIAEATGQPLPPGSGFDADGNPTTDPARIAQGGTLTSWGGHRGSGLAMIVQLFGILAGGGISLPVHRNVGFFYLAMRPDLLMPADLFKARVEELRAAIHALPPAPGAAGARLPYERGAIAERLNRERGIEIDDQALARIRSLIADGPKKAAE